MSMLLRNVHTTLTEEYEWPAWVSYGLFAVATIALGGLLGLIMVCVVDCLSPADKQQERRREAERKKVRIVQMLTKLSST